MSVNKVILLGHVGRDPEVRYVDKNMAVASFSLATNEGGYTLQNGTQVPERTEWHHIVAWRNLAERAEKYIRKGQLLYVEGKLRTRTWEGKDGAKHHTVEVVAEYIEMLDRRPNNPATPPTPSPKPEQKEPPLPDNTPTDDLPF